MAGGGERRVRQRIAGVVALFACRVEDGRSDPISVFVATARTALENSHRYSFRPVPPLPITSISD